MNGAAGRGVHEVVLGRHHVVVPAVHVVVVVDGVVDVRVEVTRMVEVHVGVVMGMVSNWGGGHPSLLHRCNIKTSFYFVSKTAITLSLIFFL